MVMNQNKQEQQHAVKTFAAQETPRKNTPHVCIPGDVSVRLDHSWFRAPPQHFQGRTAISSKKKKQANHILE